LMAVNRFIRAVSPSASLPEEEQEEEEEEEEEEEKRPPARAAEGDMPHLRRLLRLLPLLPLLLLVVRAIVLVQLVEPSRAKGRTARPAFNHIVCACGGLTIRPGPQT